MNALDLFLKTDAGVVLAGVAFLVGYIAAWGLGALIFWRRLTRPADDYPLAIRLALEEADAQVTALHEQNSRLAKLLAEALGGRAA